MRALSVLRARCWWGSKQAFASERQQLLEARGRAEANAAELLRVADAGLVREEAAAGSLVTREREAVAAATAREAAAAEAAAAREEAVAATTEAVIATTHAQQVAVAAEARSEVASEQVHQLHAVVQVPPRPPHVIIVTPLQAGPTMHDHTPPASASPARQALTEQSEAREAKVASLLQQNAALRSSNASMDAYVAKCTSRVAALVSQAQ